MLVCGLPHINSKRNVLKSLGFRFLLFSITGNTSLYYKVNNDFQFHHFLAMIYIEYVFVVSAYFT
jgi:hypothetical protein